MLFSLPKPVIFAHRGASSHAPENTLAAFRLAVEQGATAIELDVQLTADQEVIVFHDSTLDRTTDGQGRLSNYSLRDLKALNAGLLFDPAYQGEEIPALAEVFEELPGNIFINIELKNIRSPFDPLPLKTAELIRRYQAQDRVLISSFNPRALRNFQRISPEIPCGRLLYNPVMVKIHGYFPPLTSRYKSIHLPFPALSRPTIRTFQDRGLRVFSYTLNHPQDIIDATTWGVDGFFTDDPAFAIRLLTHKNKDITDLTALNQEN